jgi:hypothetical protein
LYLIYSINKIILFAGKGPQKEFYKNKIEKEEWKHVKFCLPWLESEDYPVLLGNNLSIVQDTAKNNEMVIKLIYISSLDRYVIS